MDLAAALLASLGDAVYTVDPDGRILYLNQVGVDLLGYDAEDELLGRPSHATIHHSHPDGAPFPEQDCPLLGPRLTGETVNVEVDHFVRRDGSLVPVAYSSAPVTLADGRRGAVVVFRDISRRLEAEKREREAELRASRARIVAATDDERRRLSRDLHDGAQQRLVNVSMGLDLALTRELDDGLRKELVLARDEARAAVEDLRSLARGLHPSVLSLRGLQAAIASLTTAAPIPVELDIPDARFAPAIESTAYFFVAEALTNVFKHAHATCAVVRMTDELTITVEDDGHGGAAIGDGGGLAGLRDRVAAFDGTLSIVSGTQGTTVCARLPVNP